VTDTWAWPGRHFQHGSKSENLDVLFAGSGYEASIICLHVKTIACVPGLLGADISVGNRQPRTDNRLYCTVS